MDYNQEVITAVNESSKAFNNFKGAIEARLDALEVKDAKSHRPGLGGASGAAANSETKSWADNFIRKGDLSGLDTKSMAWSTNSGADGGVAVPKQIDTNIDAIAAQQGCMLGLVRTVDSFTGDYHVIVQTSRNTNSWVGEVAARPATNTGQFADIKPSIGDLYSYPQLTQQLIDDAGFQIEQYVTERVGEEFGVAIETGILSGTGTNQPSGILSATFVATDDASRTFGQLQYVPTGVAGDWAASNKADILLSLIYKVKAGYRKNGAFVMHPQVFQEVLGFKDSQGRYLIQTAMVQGEPPTLFGYPVYESELMPVKAANSLSVLFGDFQRAYVFVNRTPTRITRDNLTNKPYIGLYTVRRVAGAVTNSEAVKALKFSVS